MQTVGDQHGHSLSGFVVAGTFAVILLAGLVVDGGQQISAARSAEATAANAARVGADAYATSSLAGAPDAAWAATAARDYLSAGPIRGTVAMRHGTIVVRTSAARPTVFLSLIGINEVRAEAEASASLVRRR